jgi:hypothetical protein
MIFSCGTRERRRRVMGAASLNGIDYLEVATGVGEAVRRTLVVHFVNDVVSPPPASDWHVAGGERFRNIQVLEVATTADPRVLRLVTDQIGDLSWYTLRLTRTPDLDIPAPPEGYDPVLSTVRFTFRPGCGVDLDCRDTEVEAQPPVEPPDVDYTARDYPAFRRVILDRLTRLQPGWAGGEPADVRMVLAEVLAYAADRLSYVWDSIGTEAYLGTARRRISIRRHARLVDYAMHDGSTARAWVRLLVQVRVPGPRADDHVCLITGPPGQGPTVVAGSPEERSLRAGGAVAFEVVDSPTFLDPAHLVMRFHTWSGSACTLPAGARSATLAGSFALQPQDVLVIAATLPDDVDPDPTGGAGAHAVRLTGVRSSTDPLTGEVLTEIEWGQDDVLPFELALTEKDDPGGPANRAAAFGNVVLVDQGEYLRTGGDLLKEPIPTGSRPALARGPVSQRPPYDREQSAAAAMAWEMDDVRPELTITAGDSQTWEVRRDLLSPSPGTRGVVLEVDDDGTGWLRFTDPPDQNQSPAASYAVGNGSAGNVGPRAINRLLLDGGPQAQALGEVLERVTNPLPATGGADPESIERVRQRAPHAYRRQQRCITPQDYADRATGLPSVHRAYARLLWTGSWHTVFLYVDRIGGAPVDEGFADTVRQALEPFRLMNHDLAIRGPIYVPLDMTLEVCLEQGALWPTVRSVLNRMFSAGLQLDGSLGLFHPDRLTFGTPVYTGPLIAAAQTVPGVAWADITELRALGTQRVISVEDGRLAIDPPQIVRLDNDPNFPDRGTVRAVQAGV